MSSLRAHELGFAYGASAPIFERLSFHLTAGWTGLVGANGAGKTTLLRLLTGELAPSAGRLQVEGRVVLCAQRVEERSADIDALAWAYDGLARRLHGRLRLDPAQLERWPTLSPGERKRWQLGAALWLEPEVLLLDEPTNHLDEEGARLLREALHGYRGVGVLVSHDRALLDEVTRTTLRLAGGAARVWNAPFSEARALWLAEAEAARATQSETKRALEKEQRRLDERRRALESSTRQRNTGARMKHRYDSDARTLGAGFRAEMAEKSHAAALRRTARRAEVLGDELAALRVHDEAGQALFVRYEPCPRPFVLSFPAPEGRGASTAPRSIDATTAGGARDASARYGDRTPPTPGENEPTGADPSLEARSPHHAEAPPSNAPASRSETEAPAHTSTVHLARDERLWIRGPNGAGKTTLLNAALAACTLPPERVLVLPQELTLEDTLGDLSRVRELPPDERGRVLQLVHALGVEPDRLLASRAPSPGEGRKLRLALGLGQHAWLAVLDEPTNHLDLPAIERLEAALRDYPGALVLVTHDAALGAAVTTRTLSLSEP